MLPSWYTIAMDKPNEKPLRMSLPPMRAQLDQENQLSPSPVSELQTAPVGPRRQESGFAFWKRKLWSKTEAKGKCLNWKLSKNKEGYGSVTLKVHQLAYVLSHGDIPAGMLICHTCDNPSCVNPEHLFLGTSADNFNDMLQKGRFFVRSGEQHPMKLHPERAVSGDRHYTRQHPELVNRGDKHWSRKCPYRVSRGEAAGLHKLTEKQVAEVRKLYSSTKYTQQNLADKFGVRQSTISGIVRRLQWGHLKDGHPPTTIPRQGTRFRTAKLTDQLVMEARSIYASQTITYVDLAKRYGVCPVTMRKIIKREDWKHV